MIMIGGTRRTVTEVLLSAEKFADLRVGPLLSFATGSICNVATGDTENAGWRGRRGWFLDGSAVGLGPVSLVRNEIWPC